MTIRALPAARAIRSYATGLRLSRQPEPCRRPVSAPITNAKNNYTRIFPELICKTRPELTKFFKLRKFEFIRPNINRISLVSKIYEVLETS